jgi:hypothetical protein
MLAKPMTGVLRGRLPQFRWEEAHQKSFDAIHELLLQGAHLSAPDYELPFNLSTDASEDGKGAVLHQLPLIPLEKQHPCSPRIHCADNLAVVQFFSKA